MENWIIGENKVNPMILSSRVRLARNLKSVPFPHKLTKDKAKDVIKNIEQVLCEDINSDKHFKTVYLWEKDKPFNKYYFEKHLISEKLIKNKDKAAFIINNDETISIMINEEDHIRIQCISCGFNIDDVLKEANRIDNILEKDLNIAFHDRLGYLTACPTNCGTGLRISVMVHLPILSMNKRINSMVDAITKVGMTIRGIYGEGSSAIGNLYQISNQITLGIDENDIVNNLKAVVNEIISREKFERENMLLKYEYELEDKIFRALGVLQSARIISAKESINLLSSVRIGVEMGRIRNININTLNELIVNINTSSLKRIFDSNLSERECSIKRAQLIREKLNS